MQLPLRQTLQLLRKHAGLVVVTSVITVGLVVGITLSGGRSYTSTASFMPQTRSTGGNLSGFAAQLGLVLPTADGGRSPAFYADLIETRQILGSVVDRSYAVSTDTGTARMSLIEFYGVRGTTDALKREAAITRLRGRMDANLLQRTGMVRVAVRATDPAIAPQILSNLLNELNRFNLETRQSQAAMERRFTEQRLEEVRQSLREAEDRLQSFLQRNRDYRNSPQLSFEQDRLAREVVMRQQLYTALSQAHEQARIDEVRDTPVITIVEQPGVPVKADGRGLLRRILLGLVLGTVLGLAIAWSLEKRR